MCGELHGYKCLLFQRLSYKKHILKAHFAKSDHHCIIFLKKLEIIMVFLGHSSTNFDGKFTGLAQIFSSTFNIFISSNHVLKSQN